MSLEPPNERLSTGAPFSHGKGVLEGTEHRPSAAPGRQDLSPLWFLAVGVGLVSISVLFVSIATVSFLRGRNDLYVPQSAPSLLWLSSLLLISSSITLERSRRALRRLRVECYSRSLQWTVTLGVAFLLSQTLIWFQMAEAGHFRPGSSRAWFLTTLTGAHAAHVLAGLAALGALALRRLHTASSLEAIEAHQPRVDLVAVYWHAMGAIWTLLFAFLAWQGL